MVKKKSLVNPKLKIFLIIFLTIVVLSASGCLESKKVINITTTIVENNAPIITDVEANSELIQALKYPKDIPPNFPGVYVLIIYKSNRINYWTSVPYTGPGTYELISGLRFIPPEGEEAKVIVTVNDEMGDRIALNTATVTF